METIEGKTPEGIFYRCWKGEASSHVVIYLHGVQSHSGWMQFSAERLVPYGVTLYAPDRRGSGCSGFPEGDFNNPQELLTDLKLFIQFVKQAEPNKKIHLAGLCWGARLALPLCQEESFESLILMAPGLYSKADYSFFKKCLIAWAALWNPNRKFPLPLKDEWFTRNLSFLNFIKRDPLGLRQVTARFLMQTVRLNYLARRALKEITLPTLLLLGSHDQIVNTERTIQAFHQMKTKKKILKIYPGFEHALEFEKNNLILFEDLFQWFEHQQVTS